MQHTLIAVFDNHADAMSAKNELLSSGYSSSDVRLSHGDETLPGGSMSTSETITTTTTTYEEPGIGTSIKNFFSDIFGSDNDEHSTKYSSAVQHGNHVLSVSTDSEAEVERAADIVERFGPIDIDEQSAKWGETAGMSPGAMQGGAGSMSGGQSASLQSDPDRLPLNQQSLNDPNPMGTTYQEPMGSRDQLSVGSYGTGSGSAAGSAMGSSTLGSQQRDTSSAAIPVVQEQLKVGKREVQRGGVRVYSRIVETPVDESIGLREEHVKVERRPVNEPISGMDTTAFKEQSIEMRETTEEAVVEKSARVVEEVMVNKEVTQREQQIHDTVRHTEVEVEEIAGSASSNRMGDDDYYRNHFTSTYGNTGDTYDTYQPAYSYGTQMRQSEMYRNRPWDEVEPELRSNWETRNTGSTGKAGSTWEHIKAAVRHGWDKVTK